ncbi:MAG: magnesium transporter [Planctomycetota bacterium]
MQDETWRELATIVDEGTPAELTDFLEQLEYEDRAYAVARLPEEARQKLLITIEPEEAAEIIEGLPESQVSEAFEQMPAADAARIVEELQSHHAADVVGELEPERAAEILDEMDVADAMEVRALAAYDDDVAGGLMLTELLEYDADLHVGDVVADLQSNAERYEGFDVQYVYVVDSAGRLVGVLYLRDLLLTPPWRPVREIMLQEPLFVSDSADVEELRSVFDSISFNAVPVVDASQRLLGVVRRSALQERLAERSEQDYLLTQGIVGGEELRTMPMLTRSGRRLSWLSVNIVLNFFAASVIAANEEVLQQVIALAVFLPILSDMSGCSGNQAVAVSMRELSLGLVEPREALRVALKEVMVGTLNGAALGVLVGGAAWAYSGMPWLGLVVGVALMLNTMIAVVVGGTVPLMMKRFGVDPALASGPLLTTVTDMCGFFLVLTMASALLPRLVGAE